MKSVFLSAVVATLLAGNAVQGQDRGPVTNLPLPRYVSLKASEGNVRRGPSLTHRIDWVFTRKDVPLEITAEHGHWRRVRDRDGVGGWIHYSLLSGARTVIVEHDMLELLSQPADKALVVARLELGVIARVLECDTTWCRLSAAGYKGWAPKERLWGVRADEIVD
ncbi:SH3 domain-containing protein [Roseovarius sp. CAU 1744]|uniref:SH3 domain-containing protein n=1 Tax=Roseovarius sp. CAU 1744 TaxID=3140368 RepID=UPI00325A7AC5